MLVLWPLPGGVRAHFPDFCIDRGGDGVTICEVTRHAKLDRVEMLAQYALMADTARSCGWHFEIRTELPAQVVKNQALLRAYRHSGPSDDATWATIRDGLTWPQQMRSAVDVLRDGGFGDSVVLHLLAVGRLTADLTRPLAADSLVWPAIDAEGAKSWIQTM